MTDAQAHFLSGIIACVLSAIVVILVVWAAVANSSGYCPDGLRPAGTSMDGRTVCVLP